MKIKKLVNLSVFSMTMVISACSHVPDSVYGGRGSPESLLDVSSEIVTIELNSKDALAEIREWAESDQPTRAEIHCSEGSMLCDKVEEVFVLYGVSYDWFSAPVDEVNLVYERIIAHDCQNRYIDNRVNPYNMNHPSFGCSAASNIVQMVSDRRQFVNPSLLGLYDGESALKGMQAFRDFDGKSFFGGDQKIEDISFTGSN